MYNETQYAPADVVLSRKELADALGLLAGASVVRSVRRLRIPFEWDGRLLVVRKNALSEWMATHKYDRERSLTIAKKRKESWRRGAFDHLRGRVVVKAASRNGNGHAGNNSVSVAMSRISAVSARYSVPGVSTSGQITAYILGLGLKEFERQRNA